MISFRTHVVSLLAVLLALAVGIVLGGGPLSSVSEDLRAAGATAPAEDPATVARADFGDAFATATGRASYGDGLQGQPVSILVMPGADEAVADDLVEQLESAGASIAGRWHAGETLVEPGEKALVDSLGSQLVTQQAKDDVSPEASTYDRAGQLIGLALATRSEKAASADNATATIAESLRAGELLTGAGEPETRAPYVVVVLGEDSGSDTDPIYAGILEGLTRQANAVLVAGSAEDGLDGRLARLRQEPVARELVTVDGVDHAAGAVTSVLALGHWPETRGGMFGAAGSDGAVPLG